jgi:valyl-tRNA synthetase
MTKQKGYDPNEAEPRIMKFWEEKQVFKFNSSEKTKPIFSIDTPPPTVSGRMHIGHACSYSQQDFLARYKRMKGFNIFYPFGTDDNGLPTERLVEKTKKIKSKDMSRTDFIKLCLDFLEEELPKFIQDWKNIGISCDWNLYYSTINDHSRKISQWSFLDLYKKGRMQRRDAPSMWCPECQTGVAQVEVEDKEFPSKFIDVKLKVGNEDLIISTTRPELFPASVAVFYHPDDERYKHLKGKTAKIPLFDIEVPILEDKRAKMDKGTGIAYCATFGDQTDMEWQKAYNLPIKEAISHEGKMTKIAGKYSGLPVKEARKEIIKDLKSAGLLMAEKEIIHPVNVHERCGTEIEFVKSKQWFLHYLDLKEDMLKWGNELKWYPEFMKVRYDNWVKGLQWDWLVSNQRHFGISFPVWYCQDCEEIILAKESDLPVDPMSSKPPVSECPKCKSKKIIPEKDVLNTWFTSSMSPQIATSLVDENTRKRIFPMSLRPQAHEIISFWLFNTLIKSQLHFNKNPWKDVVISGFVTLKGEKMSKSKGNVVNPQEIIEKYGADAVRFWASSSKLGKDFDYQEQDVVKGKKLITKLYNASKFVFMNLEDYKNETPKSLEKIDEEFLNHLDNLVSQVTNYFESYSYSHAKELTEKFFFKDFADDYIEIVKKRIYNETGEPKISAQYALKKSLLTILKLFAPIIPFITEEIYQTYFKETEKKESLHITSWPEYKENSSPSKSFLEFQEILSKIRQEKTIQQKSMNSEITLTLEKEKIKNLKEMLSDLKSVTAATEIYEGEFKVEFN